MKRKIIIGCVALVVLVMSSCSDWLSVQPSDRQTEEQLFATKEGFHAALNGIYTKLNNDSLYGKALSYEMIEIMAKRYVVSTKNKFYYALSWNAYTDDNVVPKFASVYELAYTVILNCNIFLKNVELKKDMLGSKNYEMLKGEVLALRAFMHFDLLRIFGPIYIISPDDMAIPYSTSAIGEPSDILSAKVVIEEYILKDITTAEALLLNSDPVIKEGALAPKEITDEKDIYDDDNSGKYRQLRFNYYALQAFKARVLLYKGDAAGALTTAKNVISELETNKFFPFVDPNTLLGNTVNPDRMFSTEILFGSYRKFRGEIYDKTFNPEKAGDDLLQPMKGFINNLLKVGDYRKTQWGVSGSSSNPEPVLIKHRDLANNLLFYATITPLIRVSELYLIAAEAEPNFADGSVILNKLKVSRGEAPMNITSRYSLNEEILYEYAREFYGEGQMFFYYKRTISDIPYDCDGQNGWGEYASKSMFVIPLPNSETDYR